MTTLEKTRELFLEGAAKLAKQRPNSANARARPLNQALDTVTRKWGVSASAEQHAYETMFLNEIPPDVAVSPAASLAAAAAVVDRGVSPDGQAVLHAIVSPAVSPHRPISVRPPSAMTESPTPRRYLAYSAQESAAASGNRSPEAAPGSDYRPHPIVGAHQMAAHWQRARLAYAERQPGYQAPTDDPIGAIARSDEVADPLSEQLVSIWRSVADPAGNAEKLRKKICLYAGISKAASYDVVRQMHEIALGLASRTLNMKRLEVATHRNDEDALIRALQESSDPQLWNEDADFAWRDVLRLLSK